MSPSKYTLLYVGTDPSGDLAMVEDLRRIGYIVEYASKEMDALKVLFSEGKRTDLAVASVDPVAYGVYLNDGSLDSLNVPIVFIPLFHDDSFDEQISRNWRYALVSRDAGIEELDRALRRLLVDFEEHSRLIETEGRFEDNVDAFVLHEIICDDEGKPVDYRFLDADGNFLRRVGMKKEYLIGKRRWSFFLKPSRSGWKRSAGSP